MRPEEKDPVAAESRRFFAGGCHLLKDLDVLKTPMVQDATFRCRGTGRVRLRWCAVRLGPRGPGHGSTLGARGLQAGGGLQAGAVLRRYQEARARLAAAMGGGGEGVSWE